MSDHDPHADGPDTEERDFDDETTDPGADSTEQTLVDEEAPKLVVPWDQLSPDALRGVIEEFVTREGTEYGDQDVPLETKVAAVSATRRVQTPPVWWQPSTARRF